VCDERIRPLCAKFPDAGADTGVQ